MSHHYIAKLLLATVLCGCQVAAAQSYDPPSRVGRVSNVNGAVSLMLAGESDWRNASLNYPLTSADALWTDVSARAEIHVGASAIHLAEETSLALDAIEDNFIQLRVGQGAVHVRLRAISRQEDYEIDTPAGAILLRDVGDYRIDVTPDGQRTTFTVREGDADVILGDNSYPVRSGTSVIFTTSQSRLMAGYRAIPIDNWERWVDSRNRREDASLSARYVPREMIGYEDLDQYGDWRVDAAYGPIWYPRSVSPDWAPYRTGRWESVAPWGWTWIDDAPWGFAPFHYGRWSHRGGRWGWTPGNMVARPVYAPALVAFVSGSNWSVSLSFGSSGGVGWVPLGPQEVYVPAYRASPTYIRNVNITNVNVTNINVTNINVNTVHYVNRSIPGAVTAVPRDAFIGSRPVQRAAVRVRPTDLAAAHISVAPVAAGTPVAPPPHGSAIDRARPDKVGKVQKPPVELKRSADPPARSRPQVVKHPPVTPSAAAIPTPPPAQGRGRGRAGQQAPVTPPAAAVPTPPPAPDRGRKQVEPQPPAKQPPVIPPTQTQGRGRAGQQQVPPAPPAVIPTPPPTQDKGRGRAGQQQVPPAPPAVIPTPPPTQDKGRGRAGQRQVPPAPPTATPTPPAARDRGRKQADSQPPAPVKQSPVTAPVVIPQPPGRKQPAQPTPPAPKPGVPAKTPVTPRGGGRATPTQPTTPVVRGRATPPDTGKAKGKPAKPGTPGKTKPDTGKTKPDTGRGGGGPSLQLEYQL